MLVLSGAKKLGQGNYLLGQSIINRGVSDLIGESGLFLVKRSNIHKLGDKLKAHSILIVNQDHHCENEDQLKHNDELTFELIKQANKHKYSISHTILVTQSGGLYANWATKHQKLIQKISLHKITSFYDECGQASEGGTGGMKDKLEYILRIMSIQKNPIHLGHPRHVLQMARWRNYKNNCKNIQWSMFC